MPEAPERPSRPRFSFSLPASQSARKSAVDGGGKRVVPQLAPELATGHRLAALLFPLESGHALFTGNFPVNFADFGLERCEALFFVGLQFVLGMQATHFGQLRGPLLAQFNELLHRESLGV